MAPSTHLFVGGYTREPYGQGPGLVRFALAPGGAVGAETARARDVVNPSFLADGGSVLLAVEELGEGRLAALDPATLEVLGRLPSGGADPCHLMLRGGDVWAANYSSGTASVTPLDALLAAGASGATAEGTTAAPPTLLSHPGSGPVPQRQAHSHAHQVTATPWGTVLVADLGADKVDVYGAESRVLLGSAELPPGTGPRHVALKGSYLLVAGELDGHLHVLRRGTLRDGSGPTWLWLFRTPLAPTAADITGDFAPSHIQLSADGSRLYAAVRGPDTLVVLDVEGLEEADPSVANTAPTPPTVIYHGPSGGRWPRHFVLDNGMLYVANQLSDTVDVFSLDARGLPGPKPVQSLAFASPACVLPA